jgi:enterochelin esterase family protein
MKSILLSLVVSSLALVRVASAQDMALSMLLLPGEEWKQAFEGVSFADGPTADAEGNFYFAEMRSEPPVVWKVSPDGKKSKLVEGTSCSGLKWGPDGKLYACVGKDKQLVAFEFPGGKKSVIAEDVQPNDLVVTHKGHIYFTETGKKQVTFVDAKTGAKKAAYVGVPASPAPADGKKKGGPAPYDPNIINAPNGITLSPDGGTLAVSDARGMYVWAFRVEKDGSLGAGAPYMTMRTPVDTVATTAASRTPVYKTTSGGDGMCSDTLGRFYVATDMGVQVFDPTGRMSGVLPSPSTNKMTSVGFGGAKRDVLYATCGDKLYARKVNATGTLFFLPPTAAAPAKKK